MILIPLHQLHEELIESNLQVIDPKTFYHYFPLIYAMSESTEKFFISEIYAHGDLFVGDNKRECYIPSLYEESAESLFRDEELNKIWIMSRPPERLQHLIKHEVFDVNYIFDLSETIKIKNFRKNADRFIKENNPVYSYVSAPETAWEVIKQWYQKSKRDEFTDFGYTRWLSQNYEEFEDLRARLIYVNYKPVGFSLWGSLSKTEAVHLICKDVGYPYLQDFIRKQTYREMLLSGFKTVNDGRDCGIHGIRMFKMKLRPKYILPIYSWVRK